MSVDPAVYDASLCMRCGGHCCKTMPGATVPEEWGAPDALQMQGRLSTALRTARWIVAIARETRLLYVMPRKLSHGCAFLTATGCSLSDIERPAACRSLMPMPTFPLCRPFTGHLPEHLSLRWKPYQALLRDLDDESVVQIRKPKRIWEQETIR